MSNRNKQLRSICLFGFEKFVADAGGNFDALAAKAGIPHKFFRASDDFIPVCKFENLLEQSAEALDNDILGLEYAFSIPNSLPSFTPISFLAYLSRDILEWINFSSQYLTTHNYPSNVRHRIDFKEPLISLEILQNDSGADKRHILEYNLAMTYRLAKLHVNSKYAQPVKIRFPHAPKAEMAIYEQMFNCPVEFECTRCELLFDRRILEIKLDTEDALLEQNLLNYLNFRTKNSVSNLTTAQKVQLIIPPVLGTGRCNLYSISKLLGMSTKALQRQLESENTSFSELLDEKRQGIAKRLLENTDKSSTAIAILLDYSSLKAFSFAFKRWTGTTPNRYR